MIFAKAEHLERLRKVKERMQGRGIDLLLVTDPANMNYLSGYDGWSFHVHQLLVVSLIEEEPIWIGHAEDVGAARVTTWLEPAHVLGYGDDYAHSIDRHPMDFVADHLRLRGWDGVTVAVEMDSVYFTAAAYESLRRHLPNATFTDGTRLVNRVRAVKSDAEVTLMREAAAIVDRVMEVAIDAVAPGVRQCDAAARISEAQARGTEAYGGDYTAIAPLLPTGAGTSTPHLTWTDRLFADGEATVIDLAGCRCRYHCPMARTVYLGPPPKKLEETAEVVVEGLNAALDAARPGVRAEEVEEAWRRVVARHGLGTGSRIGYSTGLGYPPDWDERTVDLRPGDTTELQPNMTLHICPGIRTGNWGIGISECCLVTEGGAEALCRFPRRLFVKD